MANTIDDIKQIRLERIGKSVAIYVDSRRFNVSIGHIRKLITRGRFLYVKRFYTNKFPDKSIK